MGNANSELNGVTWNTCIKEYSVNSIMRMCVCLFTDTHADMILLLQHLDHKTALVSLKIDIAKTEEMRIGSIIVHKAI